MAVSEVFTVKLLPGLQCDGQRGLGFLISSKNKEIDAKLVFDGLSETAQETLLNRFDYWLSGNKHDAYFHGWPNEPDYKNCWSFRWKQNKEYRRMYGFKYHPRPLTQRDYEVCILVSYGTKDAWETDPSHKIRAEALRANTEVIKAVKKAFPEHKETPDAKYRTLDRKKH